MTSTFLGYKLYANNYDASLQRIATEPAVAGDEAYYKANIGKVTSVDQFVNNYRLFSFAMKAFGLSDLGNAKAFMKKVLESDLSSSSSFANRLSDARYTAFAKAFQFTATGAVTPTATIQTAAQQSDTMTRFAAASTATSAAKTAAAAYYTAHIGEVTDVADLESDNALVSYVKTAYGLDSKTSNATLTDALESDLSDSKSDANTSSTKGLKALASDFNFAADGSVSTHRQLQSATRIAATVSAYNATVGSGTAAKAAAASETSYYEATVPTLTTVDQFLADKRLVAYAETAYGLSSTTTTSQLKAILTSDLASKTSAAVKAGSVAETFAAAFNATTTGTIALTPSVQAQDKSGVETVTNAYLEQSLETDAESVGAGVRLALYFRQKAASITSPYQILADKALTEVVQTMLGLPASSSNANVDAQARTIKSKLNFADLKDPQKLDKLIARFAALYDLKNASTQSSSSTSTLTL